MTTYITVRPSLCTFDANIELWGDAPRIDGKTVDSVVFRSGVSTDLTAKMAETVEVEVDLNGSRL